MLTPSNEFIAAPEDGTDDKRWALVLARQEGDFVYAVKSTGVYCRPNCPARRPRRQNVEFFCHSDAAELAGYRPCRRCRPTARPLTERNAQVVAEACRRLAQPHSPLSLDELAQEAGLSRFYFQRLFKAYVGTTPKQYAKACRDARIRQELQRNESITDAIYAAGFESPGRFYERAGQILGMKANSYKNSGQRQLIWYTFAQTWLGLVLIAGTVQGLCAVRFGESEATLLGEIETRFANATLTPASGQTLQWVVETLNHIEQPMALLNLPLDIQGTAFQQRVWQALREIPPGVTTSYSDIAHRLGRPKAVRAVANACGANPLAVIIPCHRLMRSDGGLGGYRWGVERKMQLLQREGADPSIERR